MKTSFSLLLAVMLTAVAAVMLNCGGGSRAVSVSSGPVPVHHQFALAKWQGDYSIILMNNDGSGQRVIPSENPIYAVQETPDHKQGVASIRDDSGHFQIYYLNLSDQNHIQQIQLTDSPEDHWSPQISWDGRKVIYLKNSSVFLMSSSGGPENEIPTSFNVGWPSFTPDGKIVFEQGPDGNLAIMNADGTDVVQITNHHGQVYWDKYPSVSADGETIVYTRHEGYQWKLDVWSVNIDGTNLRQLTTDACSADPMFVNDKIVFVSWRWGLPAQVYSMDPDGSNQMLLTDGNGRYYFDFSIIG